MIVDRSARSAARTVARPPVRWHQRALKVEVAELTAWAACRCISAPAHPSETLCRTMSLPLCRGSPTSEDACTTSLPMSNHLQGHCMPATLHSLMASPSAGSSDSYPGPDRNKPFQDDDGIVHIVAPEAPDEACDHAAGEGRFMPKADLFSTAHSDSREVSFAQLLNELASKSAGANEVACRSHSFDAGDRAPPISDHAHRTSYDFVHSGFTTNSDSTAPYRAGATELASLGSIGPPRSRRGATTKSASMHNESRPGRPKPAKQPRALAVPLSVAPPSPLAAKDSLQACASTLHRCSSMASLRPDAASRHRNPSMRLLRVLSSNDYETQLKWSN